eukprot:symbB.v1.2.016658.t1/scaffold1274.1/size127343/13
MASGCVFQGNAESSWERGKGHSKGSAPSSRWWTDSPEACPICGFPIRLLPYPPFKLQAAPNSDGKFPRIPNQKSTTFCQDGID